MRLTNGYILPAVLFVAILIGLLQAILLLNQKRLADNQLRVAAEQDFKFVSSKLTKIFSTQDLCTCNLRDTTITFSSGGPPNLPDPIRFSETTNLEKTRFGLYRLSPVRTSPATLCPQEPNTIPDQDTVLFTQGPVAGPAMKAEYVLINSYSYEGPVGGLDRYKAKMIIASNTRAGSKSTQNSPMELDLFLEVAAGKIRQCYAPSFTLGRCGPAHGNSFATVAEASAVLPQCLDGNPIPPVVVFAPGVTSNWQCLGTGGAPANCSASVSAPTPCDPLTDPSRLRFWSSSFPIFKVDASDSTSFSSSDNVGKNCDFHCAATPLGLSYDAGTQTCVIPPVGNCNPIPIIGAVFYANNSTSTPANPHGDSTVYRAADDVNNTCDFYCPAGTNLNAGNTACENPPAQCAPLPSPAEMQFWSFSSPILMSNSNDNTTYTAIDDPSKNCDFKCVDPLIWDAGTQSCISTVSNEGEACPNPALPLNSDPCLSCCMGGGTIVNGRCECQSTFNRGGPGCGFATLCNFSGN